jgi:predicted alpha/beta superfamily hydrolase
LHGQIYHYRPASNIDPARRDYHPGRPHHFHSAALGENRLYRVYLPRGYGQHQNRRYPVVYMNDGQNIFERGAFGTWSADVNLDRLIGRGETRELIVVAVDHGPGRFGDYVPPEDGGRADRYAHFLAHELKPHIDSHYRTWPGPWDTAIIGSSLGGVASLYVAWNQPHIFGKAASLSGAWWLRRWRDRLAWQSKRPVQCYIDSGDSGHARDCVHHTLALRRLLTGIGYRPGQDLMHQIARGHTHNESSWGKRLGHPLRFFFPAS